MGVMEFRYEDAAGGDMMVLLRASDVELALRRARALFISPPGKRQALDEMQNGGKRGRSGRGRGLRKPKALTHVAA